MPCRPFDDLILEYCENALEPEDRGRVEAHVARCAECRAFLEMQSEIETALPRAIGKPALSPAFRQRLMRRVESEDEGRWGWVPPALDVIGTCSVAAICGVVAQASLSPADPTWILAGASLVLAGWTSVRLLRQS